MTFLEKFELLKKSIPVPAITIDKSTIDCEYVDYAYGSKNCYYCFTSNLLKDSMYSTMGWGDKLVDCTYLAESERCFQCVDCTKCYSSTYLMDCNSTTDCHFSAFLNSCNDCFGCVALTHKKYCIFNKQYTKDEYMKKVEELKKEKPEKILKQMLELKKQIPHPASIQYNNEKSPYGDYIYDSKNVYWGFNCWYGENCGYIYTGGTSKNSWDTFFSGGFKSKGTISERVYEQVDSVVCYDCAFLNNCNNCTNCYYSADMRNCSDCFGCVGLSKKKYCILNNQLTKDQYEKAVKNIRKELGWKS